MKIAVFCHAGICRSAAMSNELKRHGHDVLNAGLGYNSEETIAMLGRWADKIVVMQKELLPYVPEEFREKSVLADVGPDVWKSSSDRDLQARVKVIADEWEKTGWAMNHLSLRPH